MNEMKCPVCGTVFEAKGKYEPEIMIQGPSEHDESSDTDIERELAKQYNEPKKSGGFLKFGCLGVIGFIALMAFVGLVADRTDNKPKTTNQSYKVSQRKTGPRVSSFDSSVLQVKRYLRQILKDPDSYEGVDWSKVVTTYEPGGIRYKVRHRYRAKNSYGAVVTNNQIFYMDAEGNVINHDKFGM